MTTPTPIPDKYKLLACRILPSVPVLTVFASAYCLTPATRHIWNQYMVLLTIYPGPVCAVVAMVMMRPARSERTKVYGEALWGGALLSIIPFVLFFAALVTYQLPLPAPVR